MTKLDELYNVLSISKEGWISLLALKGLLNVRYDEIVFLIKALEDKGLLESLCIKHIEKQKSYEIMLYKLLDIEQDN